MSPPSPVLGMGQVKEEVRRTKGRDQALQTTALFLHKTVHQRNPAASERGVKGKEMRNLKGTTAAPTKTRTPNIDINKQIDWSEEIPINTNQAQLAFFAGKNNKPSQPLFDWSPQACILMRHWTQNSPPGLGGTVSTPFASSENTSDSGHLLSLVYELWPIGLVA